MVRKGEQRGRDVLKYLGLLSICFMMLTIPPGWAGEVLQERESKGLELAQGGWRDRVGQPESPPSAPSSPEYRPSPSKPPPGPPPPIDFNPMVDGILRRKKSKEPAPVRKLSPEEAQSVSNLRKEIQSLEKRRQELEEEIDSLRRGEGSKQINDKIKDLRQDYKDWQNLANNRKIIFVNFRFLLNTEYVPPDLIKKVREQIRDNFEKFRFSSHVPIKYGLWQEILARASVHDKLKGHPGSTEVWEKVIRDTQRADQVIKFGIKSKLLPQMYQEIYENMQELEETKKKRSFYLDKAQKELYAVSQKIRNKQAELAEVLQRRRK